MLSPAQPVVGHQTGGIRVSRTLLILCVAKTAYLLVAYFVFSRLTQLGDTPRYLNSGRSFGADVFIFSTAFMEWTGSLFLSVLRVEFLANLPAVAISAYGLAYCLVRMRLSRGDKNLLMILLLTPTLAIWTSIHSKEAITTFSLCVILGWYIEFMNEGRYRPNLVEFLACYLVVLFKPQYTPALGVLFATTLVAKKARSGWVTIVTGVTFACFGIAMLYALRDLLDEVTKTMFLHFLSPEAASTRPDDFFDSEYAFLTRAGYGMLLAFWGPTISEAASSLTHLFAFIESTFIIGVFVILVWSATRTARKTARISALALVISLSVPAWLLFAHYPFGVFNPGSAIRYRAGFLSFLILLAGYFCLDRRLRRPA